MTRVAVATCLLGIFVLLASGATGGAGTHPRGNFDLAAALAFDDFPLYDAGDPVDGLALAAILRRHDTADYVSFVYGDCVARDDLGCAPPAEVQVWPACRRNLGLYDVSPRGTPVPERAVVRGVPAAFFEDEGRLELQTGRSTVVVFADSPNRTLRIASALRRVGRPFAAGPLPRPDAGAVEGTLRC